MAESSSKNSHSHDLPIRNPHSDLSPSERLERLFLFLEAQFGAENCVPIEIPKIPNRVVVAPDTPPTPKNEDEGSPESSDDDEERDLEAMQKNEIERLHRIGIPVPGIEIMVDKMVAKVWLEDLEVECANRVFGDRVRAVVERAVEVMAPLWA